jgi:hypothetical protein
MFQEKSQRSATEDNTVEFFVFGTRTGRIMRTRVFSLFGDRAGFFQGAALTIPTGSSPAHLNPELIVFFA